MFLYIFLSEKRLSQSKGLLSRGVHPIKIIRGYMSAAIRACEIITV